MLYYIRKEGEPSETSEKEKSRVKKHVPDWESVPKGKVSSKMRSTFLETPGRRVMAR
jgi:hypothetical protein